MKTYRRTIGFLVMSATGAMLVDGAAAREKIKVTPKIFIRAETGRMLHHFIKTLGARGEIRWI